jgi:hypothetical protein
MEGRIMEKHKNFISFVFCLLMFFVITATCSALGPKITTSELVDKAGDIIHGRVIQKYQPDPNIYSVKVVVEVRQTIKGESSPEKTFSIPGGVVNGKGVKYSNMPLIKKGDEVLLFLSKKDTRFPLVGWNQGCLHMKGGMILEKGVRSENFISKIEKMVGEVEK